MDWFHLPMTTQPKIIGKGTVKPGSKDVKAENVLLVGILRGGGGCESILCNILPLLIKTCNH
jgi:hypothetical protein